MNNVEFILSKGSEHPPERWISDGIALTPRGLNRPESVGVRVRFSQLVVGRGEDMHRMTPISKLLHERIHADAHPV